MLHAQGQGEGYLDLRKIEWVMQFRLGLQIDLQIDLQTQPEPELQINYDKKYDYLAEPMKERFAMLYEFLPSCHGFQLMQLNHYVH